MSGPHYTRRVSNPSWPTCLMIESTGDIDPLPGDVLSWMRRHNDSVTRHGQTAQERVILRLGSAIHGWVHVHGVDDLSRRTVVVPLIEAFRAALNYDCGQLDCGTLDGWACDLLTANGIDPDSGEWLPDAPAG